MIYNVINLLVTIIIINYTKILTTNLKFFLQNKLTLNKI
jgi:hypothetical protein